MMREIMADIVSRPNYINGKMTKAKLSFGNPEEPFPVSLSEKIPIIGRVYKASETAFAGQAYKNRADILINIWRLPKKQRLKPVIKNNLKVLVNWLTH